MDIFGKNDHVKIDQAHAELLKGLVVANKPKSILELGIGGGASADAILEGLAFNQQQYDYTLVDNWMDFGYKAPDIVVEKYSNKINLITSNEKDFVFSCRSSYDFIMSDADHESTDQWFEYVYENILNDSGILCYHDISVFYPNLLTIYNKCKERKLSHKLFNRNSLSTEKCERGLLVIFKN
jgi:predicted O-methyltransferase YrrM